jgi:hypothetical protein
LGEAGVRSWLVYPDSDGQMTKLSTPNTFS